MTKESDFEGTFVTVVATIAFLSFNGVVLAGLFKILANT